MKKGERSVFPRWFAACLSVAAILGISYIWLITRCEAMARDIKKTEERVGEVQRRILNEEYKWSNTCTLRRVREQLARFHIEMDWPDKDRIVHLSRALEIADAVVGPGSQLAGARRPNTTVHD